MSVHPRCPVDDGALEAHVHGALAFHGCTRCHGLWFTAGAMDATRHGPVPADPFAGRTDAAPASAGGAKSKTHAKARRCPGCAGELRPREVDGVEVDTCPACRSVWLDAGEFDAVVAWQRLRERSVTAGGVDRAKVAKATAAVAAVAAAAATQEEPSRPSRLEVVADVAEGVVDVAGEGWLVVEMVGDLAGFLGDVVVGGGELALEAAGAVLSLVGGLLEGF